MDGVLRGQVACFAGRFRWVIIGGLLLVVLLSLVSASVVDP